MHFKKMSHNTTFLLGPSLYVSACCYTESTYRVINSGTPKERLKEFFPVPLGRVGGLNHNFETYIMEPDSKIFKKFLNSDFKMM